MFDSEKIMKAIAMILEAIGEDPMREGLRDTPERVARMYEEIFSGLSEDPGRFMEVTFNESHDELVLVKDIPFYSMCEHHLVPFFGKAHIAYIPREGRIAGLSKLARVVEALARRPQNQERLTSQIANLIRDKLTPQGVAVVVQAEHLCMSMRGVNKPGAVTVTSAMRGIFRRNEKSRAEVLSLIRAGR